METYPCILVVKRRPEVETMPLRVEDDPGSSPDDEYHSTNEPGLHVCVCVCVFVG